MDSDNYLGELVVVMDGSEKYLDGHDCTDQDYTNKVCNDDHENDNNMIVKMKYVVRTEPKGEIEDVNTNYNYNTTKGIKESIRNKRRRIKVNINLM